MTTKELIDDNIITVDGVLYSKDMNTLLKLPEGQYDRCVIPDTVKKIKHSFIHNDCLKSVIIPASVIEIKDFAFGRCYGLISITVHPDNPNYSSENGVLFNKAKTILKFCPRSRQGEYVVPDTVTEIDDHAFCDCSGLTSIIIPASIKKIANYLFLRCSALTSITIPDMVTDIGKSAFSDCTALMFVYIPASVCEIDEDAFSGCTALSNITVHPDNPFLTSENGNLFNKDKTVLLKYYQAQPGDFKIPETVTVIGDGAVRNCVAVTSAIIPKSVKKIGFLAFGYCSGLTTLVISDSVTEIDDGAFYACSGLTRLVIPQSVTKIGDLAFNDCTSLKFVVIPDSVTKIGDNAFENCTDLIKYNQKYKIKNQKLL